jgi:transposase
MCAIKKRKFYTPEFKTQVALEALRGVRTIDEIGQEYGVHPVAVGHWKKELQKEAKTLFDEKLVQGLMRQMGLAGMASGPNISRPHQEHKVYPYLLRDVSVVRPD